MPDEDDLKPISHDEAFRRFSRTRKAEGGIKLQQKRRTTTVGTWWGGRWLSVLESFDLGTRLDRGKTYARKGQVVSLEVTSGTVNAEVQGSRREPYSITIKINTLSQAEWQKVIDIFAQQAAFAAKLLARQMPLQVEHAFAAAKVSLFPSRQSDLKTSCSCPDWSNPCKHIAAVYYLLGEEFGRDPFLIFRLRGLGEDELMAMLDSRITGTKPAKRRKTNKQENRLLTQPITTEHRIFWKGVEEQLRTDTDLEPPIAPAMLPRSLGAFPFWRGETDFWAELERVYEAATQQIKADLGEP